MIDRSSAYDQAITARRRRITVRATFDLRDPDAVVSGAASSAQSPYSQIGQVYDEITDQTDFKLGTLEQDRIQLDGSWALPPDDPDEVAAEQLGWWGGVLSGADGTFASPQPYIELTFTGMSILQAFTLWFSQNSYDGVPESFRVDVYSAATLAFSRIVEGNADYHVLIEQFTVYDPTRIRITMLKWSRSYTYPRLTDLFFGLFEQWSGRDIYSVDVLTESTFTGLSLPYSTCDLEAYNKGHRFDPYAPNSLFLSIEERQAIPIDWGIYLPDGSIEWVPGGWYYQQSGGWEIKDLTVRWSLVDIIGMLVDRNYSPPDTLPTTLGGWIASIVACLGVNLAGRYIVDDEVKDLALTAAVEDVTDLTCGEVLRFACMATAAWPHQDFATGFLRVSKRRYDTGANITGSNMPSWPKMQANEEIADITFKLDDNQEVTFPGTNTASDKSLTVDNPFVHTTDDARRVVANVMSQYGGRKFTVRSRGNPASETGDIDTVATAFGTTISARRYKHQLKLVDGVMRNLPSYLIQTDTDKSYDHTVILTGAGTWTAPDGVTEIYAKLVGGGDGADGGEGGGRYSNVTPDNPVAGSAGLGGKVFVITISINSGQLFAYSCGKGGKGGKGGVAVDIFGDDDMTAATPGTSGTETIFGAYSSANGKRYSVGISDVETGAYYGATGTDGRTAVSDAKTVKSPEPNTGNGGNGGDSGNNGQFRSLISDGSFINRIWIVKPSDGSDGSDGADGVIIIQYNDPEVTYGNRMG
ncbi:hypothetical protein [Butyricicoccus pullicaecorum]|uniref:Glycine-rich domain-containing protein n=1 Tax=Butyricicoccus pullicaecorum 1.2 TaxID=1203606 RepID=R8VZ31_9FIRM|nr:hypothetical protein [Butyricicoccus pullicaecorum]EOQ37940.1 hypothetical protein HMPREF1526_00968 [Butyricicoccus pullicaecorum 1.2]SKA60708.1 hypothetical protein SAMN02745978_01948 [Butyricicoccus pullicaecorum DSM 23266]